MPEFKNILLIGAYGYTARLIAAELSAASIVFSVAGRNMEKIYELKKEFENISGICCMNTESAYELSSALAGVDAVINCIGPFNIFGDKVIVECLRAGICYIDICGEQNFVRNSFMNHHETALKYRTTILHSIAFESALSDLAAKAFLPVNTSWKNISVGYFFNRSLPSPGTRLSMAASHHFPAYILEGHLMKESRIAAFSKRVSYPGRPEIDAALYAPYPDIIFLSRQFSPSGSSTYLLTNQNNARFAVEGSQQRQNLDKILELSKKRARNGPGIEERQNQSFEIIICAEESEGRKHCISLSGKDMYGLTASIVRFFIEHLNKSEKVPCGVLNPAKIDDSGRLFERIVNEKNIVVDTSCRLVFLE